GRSAAATPCVTCALPPLEAVRPPARARLRRQPAPSRVPFPAGPSSPWQPSAGVPRNLVPYGGMLLSPSIGGGWRSRRYAAWLIISEAELPPASHWGRPIRPSGMCPRTFVITNQWGEDAGKRVGRPKQAGPRRLNE